MPDTPDPLAVQVLTALDRAHARKRSPSEPWSSERKTLFTEVMSVVGEVLPEWRCPSCDAVTRARMADHPVPREELRARMIAALGEKYASSPRYNRESRRYDLPPTVDEMADSSMSVTFTAGDGHLSVRGATVAEAVDAVMAVAAPELDARDAQLERLSRGCGQHPGIPGYRHPECGFCWHGKNGLDVPLTAPPREPICPRCTLVAIRKWAAGVGASAVLAILDGTDDLPGKPKTQREGEPQ